MKRRRLVVFYLTTLFLLLTGCQSNNFLTEKTLTQQLPNSANGITIKTEKAKYPTSAKIITVLIQNDSNEVFTTGAHVFLEKKVEDTWYKVPMKANSFSEEGIIHPAGKLSSLSLNVDDLKYELTSGQYRATIGGLAAPFKVVD